MNDNIESTVERLKKMQETKDKAQELTDKEGLILKEAANYIFSLPEGIKVAKMMMKVSGIYKLAKNTTNPIEMGVERGKEYMYLFFIKGLLDRPVLNNIERKIAKESK